MNEQRELQPSAGVAAWERWEQPVKWRGFRRGYKYRQPTARETPKTPTDSAFFLVSDRLFSGAACHGRT